MRLEDVPAAPWKNGGGTTRTLAVHPPDADLDGFHWRISVADVAADGPFSPFPGVDRVLVLLSGAGMDLVPTDGFRLPPTERRARERRYDPDSGRGVRATSSEFWVVESTDEPREPRAVRRFGETLPLGAPGDLARFAGERAITGVLRAGPTLDLNVMVRRDRGSAVVDVLDAPARGPWSLVVAVSGEVTVDGEALGPGDLAWAPDRVDGTGRFVAVVLPG